MELSAKTILEKEEMLRAYFKETNNILKRQLTGEIKLSEALILIEQIKNAYGVTNEMLEELPKILT